MPDEKISSLRSFGTGDARAVRGRTRDLTAAALLAALLAASAWVQIPVQPVPITLQVFFVVLATLLLAPGWAFAALCVYLGLGAIGVPVFSGGQGGMGVLAGPTGGYLFGFLIAAGLGSSVRLMLTVRPVRPAVADIVAAAVALVSIYLTGAVQLAGVLGLTAGQAVVSGVLPFLLPDAIKAGVAVLVAGAVRRGLR